MSENDLVKGIFFKTPHNNAPDFVKRKVNIKVDEFIEYLQSKKNEAGYVNFGRIVLIRVILPTLAVHGETRINLNHQLREVLNLVQGLSH